MQLFLRFVTHVRTQARIRYAREVFDDFETSVHSTGRTLRQVIRSEVYYAFYYHSLSMEDMRMQLTMTRLRLALQRFAAGLRRLVENARRRVRRRLE